MYDQMYNRPQLTFDGMRRFLELYEREKAPDQSFKPRRDDDERQKRDERQPRDSSSNPRS